MGVVLSVVGCSNGSLSGKTSESVDKGKQASSTYTCPMHSEVRQSGPGKCPKCGMALQQVK